MSNEILEIEDIKKKKRKRIKHIILFIIILTSLICGTLYYSRYVATKGLLVKEYGIYNVKITDNFNGLKIVQISDIHYGKTTNKKDLCKLANKVNLTKPDIVVFTGDLVDKDYKITSNDANDINVCLNTIKTTIGKYTISGEDDYTYSNYIPLMESSGFINLNDNYDLIYKTDLNYILIEGISSISNKVNLEDKIKTTNDYLLSVPDNLPIYKILLIHEGDLVSNLNLDNYDLILAGHSHNGQIVIPFIGNIIKYKDSKKYNENYYKLNNTDLYISSGIGTTDYSFRLFNKPSFNFYRVMKK